jgi:small-conductance mechanosensitive channel
MNTRLILSGLALACLLPLQVTAQEGLADPSGNDTPEPGEQQPVADAIRVGDVPTDAAIATRLERILNATEWFESIAVTVDNGVVFLGGIAAEGAQKEWAGNLARNTEGVVAVVNDLRVRDQSPWDLSPALRQIGELAAVLYRSLPLIIVALALFALSWLVASLALRAASRIFGARVQSNLLRDVLARAVAALVFVLGAYVVLRVSGLTGLAVTIIGGTGLLGLAIGFAFRDIAENFLASILISIQRPFAMGDLIEVDGHTGYVRRVNTRATVIMTRDGNHVQVPNAIIYKNTITNFTANPRAREDFTVGIGYDDSIPKAQSIALEVLRKHPAVLAEPEPLVLVEELGASTVNLRILFWLDIERYSHLKVRSAVVRLTKSAFDANGISMPDEAREVIFPKGVPVRRFEATAAPAPGRPGRPGADTREAHQAEGQLASEAPELEKQASEARLPEAGKNLLKDG